MAEFVMKDLVKKTGPSKQFQIESAGTYAAGGPAYPPAKKKLTEYWIICKGKFSRQLVKADYDQFDLLISTDNLYLVMMTHMFSSDLKDKLHLLLDYADHPRNIGNPWYTRDFETVWQDIKKGCGGLLHTFKRGLY